MDFGIIRQLKIGKFWWLDTILYFVVALLLATIFCFLIFTVKISGEKKTIALLEGKIANIGTREQRRLEKEVLEYQSKIDNFATLLSAHKIPTNIFDAIKSLTLPNVWFNNLSIDAASSVVSVLGETEDIPSFSRQIEVIENQDFVIDVTGLTFDLGESGRITFNFEIAIDPNLFFIDKTQEAVENPEQEEPLTTEEQDLPIVAPALLPSALPDEPIAGEIEPTIIPPIINLYSSF